jgi:hypothetical protein
VGSFTLYGSPHSQFTYKVALMLRLAGQPFAFRYVSFQRGMHRPPISSQCLVGGDSVEKLRVAPVRGD